MDKTKLLIGSLAVLSIVSIGTSLIIYQKLKSNSCETQSQPSLISNEQTSSLNKFPDGWTTYTDKEYGFHLNYPEKFDGQKIEVARTKFKNDQELSSQIQANTVADDVKWMSGYTEMNKKVTDFNYLNNGKKNSLFAITIYSNPSNLSLKDFVSNEISNMPEGINDQRIINLNGNSGYRIVLTKGAIGMPSPIIYYVAAKDSKSIIGISSPIEIFDGGYGPDLRFEDFVKAYPKYSGDLQNMDNIWNIAGNEEELNKKYPEYKDFVKNLSAQSAQKELDERLTFDMIAYSFKF